LVGAAKGVRDGKPVGQFLLELAPDGQMQVNGKTLKAF